MWFMSCAFIARVHNTLYNALLVLVIGYSSLYIYLICTLVHSLLNMYTRSPGPRAEGVHIRQTINAHGITAMYHIAPPLVSSSQEACKSASLLLELIVGFH